MIAQRPKLAVERLLEAVDGRLDGSPLAVMLDIDGTIAPIASTPDDAVVPSEVRQLVRGLVDQPHVHVALISGRSVADAVRMTAVDGAWFIGNHGLEIRTPDGDLSAVAEVRAYEDAIAKASSMLAPLARTTSGALLENKRWTLSLHYRLVHAREAPALIARVRAIAREFGLRATPGKQVLELRPPVAIDKGTAAIAFAQRMGALENGSVLYAGDDQTDEDAFRALRRSQPRAVTIRILETAEDQARAPTEAEYTLASPDELRRLLEWLLSRRAS